MASSRGFSSRGRSCGRRRSLASIRRSPAWRPTCPVSSAGSRRSRGTCAACPMRSSARSDASTRQTPACGTGATSSRRRSAASSARSISSSSRHRPMCACRRRWWMTNSKSSPSDSLSWRIWWTSAFQPRRTRTRASCSCTCACSRSRIATPSARGRWPSACRRRRRWRWPPRPRAPPIMSPSSPWRPSARSSPARSSRCRATSTSSWSAWSPRRRGTSPCGPCRRPRMSSTD
mmetsp:Transcript_118393/g.342304  ORF Transcript_118393/g.342304 Transcript_118393/m.342304 type:complete len:233 (+) Transcript_118393:345-1043(+)